MSSDNANYHGIDASTRFNLYMEINSVNPWFLELWSFSPMICPFSFFTLSFIYLFIYFFTRILLYELDLYCLVNMIVGLMLTIFAMWHQIHDFWLLLVSHICSLLMLVPEHFWCRNWQALLAGIVLVNWSLILNVWSYIINYLVLPRATEKIVFGSKNGIDME